MGYGLLLGVLLWGQVSFIIETPRFYTLEGTPYLELLIGLEGASLTPTHQDSAYYGQADFTLVIKNLSEAVVYADKFRFQVGPWPDTLRQTRNHVYIDARRLRLPSGLYTIELEGLDPYQKPKPQTVKAVTQLELPLSQTGFACSDLLFARQIGAAQGRGYERHNLHLEPHLLGGLFIDPDTFYVFGELYHADSLTRDPCFLRFRVLDAQRNQAMEGFSVVRRPQTPKPFEAFFFRVPAQKLESGIYLAQVELFRNDGQVLATWYRRFTILSTREPLAEASEAEYDQRYNFPEKKLDELLGGMSFLATPSEKSFMKVLSTFDEKKRFFVAFWKKREGRPDYPTFKDFLYRFEYAQQHFKSTLRPGWKTDRGRVFIQYGPPNDMQFYYNEPDKYPYQIWTYNQIGAQSNVFFVFYDPDLITSEYPLLHSNKLGELQNRNWRAFLLRARAAATGETEHYLRYGSGSTYLFRDDQTIGFTRDDR